jgi:peptidyl-prolyl cis-trans isomerase B (cyclophilin B)
LEVVEKITAVRTDASDRPLQDVMMTVDVEQMNRNKIEKEFNFKYPSF